MAPETARNKLFDGVRTGAVRELRSYPGLHEVPEVARLALTPQDPTFHAEGDVLTHTDLVLAECPALETQLPSARDGETLRLAALLHDIAKPDCTRFDAALGRLVARGHERVGGVRARYLLHELGIPGEQRRSVAELVATHHLLRRCIKGADTAEGRSFLWRLAARVDTRLLWALELADMRGRECVDRDSLVEQVELFRMLCEEQRCFGAPAEPWLTEEELGRVRFVSERARRYCVREAERRRLTGEFREAAQALAFCFEHARREPAEVLLTVGPAASGKSTWLERLPEDYARIRTDDERVRRFGTANTQRDQAEVHGACQARLREVLRAGGRAAYEATNVIPDLRAKVLGLCHEYGAYVTLWVFDVPEATLRKRNRARERTVPEAVLSRQLERFEWPLPEEAHEVRVFEGDEALEHRAPR